MPVCRHCSNFYQAASNHDAVCPATKVEMPDDWKGAARVDPPLERNDPSLWAWASKKVRVFLREGLRGWRARRRLPRICAKWNREIEAKFAEDVADQKDDPDFDVDPMIVFKWNQLVWQEILMWNSLDEPVDQFDFLFICDRGGFSLVQRRYLEEMLEFINLKGWQDK